MSLENPKFRNCFLASSVEGKVAALLRGGGLMASALPSSARRGGAGDRDQQQPRPPSPARPITHWGGDPAVGGRQLRGAYRTYYEYHNVRTIRVRRVR